MPFWYSLDSSHGVPLDEYPCARVSVMTGFLHNFVTAKLATTSIGFKEILIFYHIVKIFKLPILISDLLFLLNEHAQVGVDQAVFKRYIVNPYAAGGYFGQYKMIQKKLNNDWNPGK